MARTNGACSCWACRSSSWPSLRLTPVRTSRRAKARIRASALSMLAGTSGMARASLAIAQHAAQDLPARGPGQLVDQLDHARVLVGRHALAAEGDQLVGVRAL